MSYHPIGSWLFPGEDVAQEQMDAAARAAADAALALERKAAADAAAQVAAGGAAAKAQIEAGGVKAKVDIEAGAANAPGLMVTSLLPYLLVFGGIYLLLSGGKKKR